MQDPWGPGGSRTEAGESPSTRSATRTLQVLNLSSAMLAAGRTPPVPWNCRSTSPLLLGVVTLSIPTTLTQSRLVTLTYSVENSRVPARFFSSPLAFECFLAAGLICHIFFDGTLACYFPQVWRSGRLGSTSTTLEATETTSDWRPSVSTTGRGFVRGPSPWRLAPQTGWQRRTPGRWSTPVWIKASGALTRNSRTVAPAPTITSASNVRQVDLQMPGTHYAYVYIFIYVRQALLKLAKMSFANFANFVYLCPSLCPAQSYWSEWGEWGTCSTTFCNDVGVQVRQRTCVNSQPMPLLLVPACQGHPSERRECSTPPCTGENTNIY